MPRQMARKGKSASMAARIIKSSNRSRRWSGASVCSCGASLYSAGSTSLPPATTKPSSFAIRLGTELEGTGGRTTGVPPARSTARV